MIQLLLDIPTILVFLSVFCVAFAYRKACRPSNFPPGPPGSLFTGNLALVDKNKYTHKTIAELRKKYGPMFSLQLGWYPAIVLSDYHLVKEAFIDHGDQFSNRVNHTFLARLLIGNQGLLSGHGEVWKTAKRLSMRTLRDLGVGKATIEDKVRDETNAIVQEVENQHGEPFKLGILFAKATCNIICSLLFGCRYNYGDPVFLDLVADLDFMFKMGGLQVGYAQFLPYYAPLMFLYHIREKEGLEHFTRLRKFTEKQIEEHRKTFEEGQIRDFVDVYIETEKEEGGKKTCTPTNVFTIIVDLFMAGTETTSTTMLWGLLFMLKNPQIQEKCRKEILEVVGSERNICLKDRPNLTYVDATICEIQRLANIAPIAVMHCTDGPVNFHGYSLPDKTIVIPDLYHILMDPEHWEDPEAFKPERFLDDNGRVVRPHTFIPFSIGRRSCPGENLAKTELFIFFATLLQKFNFTATDVTQLPVSDDAQMGITLSPPPYDIIATPLSM